MHFQKRAYIRYSKSYLKPTFSNRLLPTIPVHALVRYFGKQALSGKFCSFKFILQSRKIAQTQPLTIEIQSLSYLLEHQNAFSVMLPFKTKVYGVISQKNKPNYHFWNKSSFRNKLSVALATLVQRWLQVKFQKLATHAFTASTYQQIFRSTIPHYDQKFPPQNPTRQ